MRMTGVSVQPWCGREANHEGKGRQHTYVRYEANIYKAAHHV
jgi:hypothetical protein